MPADHTAPDLSEEFGASLDLRMAVGLARHGDRPVFASVLALDHRLSRVAAMTSEAIFAQMRLAWWRDAFQKGEGARASEPLLQSLRACFGHEIGSLAALVDGWEAVLVGEGDLDICMDAFVEGRAAAFALIARTLSFEDSIPEARRAGELWALAQLADGKFQETSLLRAKLPIYSTAPRLPRGLRPLALIGGLSLRALRRGGGDLLGDRLSPLTALRIALIGR